MGAGAPSVTRGSARRLLGPGGPLARAFPGYEERSGQLDMADAVERALADDRTLLCEAGTGTGKTLAYLVPAILSGKKVVVSTATKALQEQILAKDLPLIAEHLGLAPQRRPGKGLGNYLCLRRFNELRSSAGAQAEPPECDTRFAAPPRGLGRRTQNGDVAELVDARARATASGARSPRRARPASGELRVLRGLLRHPHEARPGRGAPGGGQPRALLRRPGRQGRRRRARLRRRRRCPPTTR